MPPELLYKAIPFVPLLKSSSAYNFLPPCQSEWPIVKLPNWVVAAVCQVVVPLNCKALTIFTELLKVFIPAIVWSPVV